MTGRNRHDERAARAIPGLSPAELLALAAILSCLAGCATAPRIPEAPARPAPVAAPVAAAPVVTAPVVKPPPPAPAGPIDLARPKSFTRLERAIRKTKGAYVVLNRKLAKDLLEGENEYRSRCERLDGQLKALKNIDTETPRRIIR